MVTGSKLGCGAFAPAKTRNPSSFRPWERKQKDGEYGNGAWQPRARKQMRGVCSAAGDLATPAGPCCWHTRAPVKQRPWARPLFPRALGVELSRTMGTVRSRLAIAGVREPPRANRHGPWVGSVRGAVSDFFNPPCWPQVRRDHPLNLSILLSGGKENKRDSSSSGERTRKSPA